MNRIVISGKLEGAPEVKSGAKGDRTVCKIAVRKSFKDDSTDLFTCVATGKTGEWMAKILRDGATVVVEGRMMSYTSNGNTQWTLKVDEFVFPSSGAKRKPETRDEDDEF